MDRKIYIESLGCAKNQVESEKILGWALKNNYKLTYNPLNADLIFVNTCAFIKPAVQESIEYILNLSKNPGKLIVTGCLVSRYKDKLKKLLPEVDEFRDLNQFDSSRRVLLSLPGSAYLKISEGCNNKCSYCTIPLIKGRLKPYSMDVIIKQAKQLALEGVKELNIIAQDVTDYKPNLVFLLKELVKIKTIKWIRLLYLNPWKITDELISFIANEEKMCKYVDIPIQHIDRQILMRMNRIGDYNFYATFFQRLREKIKSIAIRTTVMVGFPGETETQFAKLKNFIKEMKFDRLGIFKYSQESGTAAALYKHQIAEKIKEKRYNELARLQKKISRKKLLEKIGKNINCIIEEKLENCYWARTEYDAPEVDGGIYVESKSSMKAGDIISVKVVSSDDYDLYGVYK